MNDHMKYGQVTMKIRNGKVERMFNEWEHDPTDTTLGKVVGALGGAGAFEALPVLDLGERDGRTGYIDFVRPEMMSAPIMRGTDNAGRPFIALRLQHNGEKVLQVEVVFRRYITGSTWTSGGASFVCAGAMSEEDIAFLSRLVAGYAGKREYKWVEKDLDNTLQDLEEQGAHHVVVKKEMINPHKAQVTVNYEIGELRLV